MFHIYYVQHKLKLFQGHFERKIPTIGQKIDFQTKCTGRGLNGFFFIGWFFFIANLGPRRAGYRRTWHDSARGPSTSGIPQVQGNKSAESSGSRVAWDTPIRRDSPAFIGFRYLKLKFHNF
jgi:hypothetical protein